MVGEFAAVLPDYHNPDIMNLIYSYLPLGSDSSLVVTQQSNRCARISTHFCVPKDGLLFVFVYLFFPFSQWELVATLVKSLRAVADSSKPSQLENALPETLLISLPQLMEIEEASKTLSLFPPSSLLLSPVPMFVSPSFQSQMCSWTFCYFGTP